MPPYAIAVTVIAAVILALFLFALLCYLTAFGKRYDKIACLKYFTADDFNLRAVKAGLPRGLNGFIYRGRGTQNGKLIIFCHGMGAGQIAYTTEIAYFCNLGFTVLAVDSRGCNYSSGRSIAGMYEGVKTVIAAIDFARASEELKHLKIYLVGHSWGAYSALCASAKRKVGGVVSISAPATPVRTIASAAANVISKPFALILSPFWYLINLFRFGTNGNLNAAKQAEKNGTPVLLVHGDCDKVVSSSNSVYSKADGGNISKLLASGKAHNPYNTLNAEKLLAGLNAKLTKGVKDFSEFDFAAATEEDAEIMRQIVSFIDNN